jgi:protein SFI1
LLNIIVTQVENNPQANNFTFRAIFDAYDRVLRENGLDPDHDQIYFRFLLRLGGYSHGTGTLRERFEALLLGMGIRLEFEELHQTQEEERPASLTCESRPEEAAEEAQPTTRRRVSDGAYDKETESIRLGRGNVSPVSTATRPATALSNVLLGSTRPTTLASDGARSEDGYTTNRDTGSEWGGRLTAREFAGSGKHHRRRGGSASTQQDAKAWRKSHSTDEYESAGSGLHERGGDNVHESSRAVKHETDDGTLASKYQKSGQEQAASSSSQEPETEDSTLASRFETSEGSLPRSIHISYNRYDIASKLEQHSRELTLRAEAFTEIRERNTIQQLFCHWQEQALRLQEQRTEFEIAATRQDRGTLLGQAFNTWRAVVVETQKVKETEHFFAHINTRAGKARDLFLLTKAFTHWAQCALDEVDKTSTARRHILKFRHFKAWRDITVVNELKARRFVLRSFFEKWKERYLRCLNNEIQALELYQRDLVERVYWGWFWSYWDREAPRWSDFRLKRKYARKWITLTRERCHEDFQANTRYRLDLVHMGLTKLLSKAEILLEWNRQADAQRNHSLLRSTIKSIKRQSILTSLANTERYRVAERLCAGILDRWRLRTQASQHAEKVNTLRILRSCWTAWNDALRCQSLAQRIDERVVLSALYRWCLAERYELLRRVIRDRIKRQTFETLMHSWASHKVTRLRNEQKASETARLGTLLSVFRPWRLQLRLAKERDELAAEFYEPKIMQQCLVSLNKRLKHIQQIEEWAESAKFYLLTKRSLKRLDEAAQASKREKRKRAYNQVRRNYKKNLCSRLYNHWHEQAIEVQELQRKADEKDRNRIMLVAMDCFLDWRQRSSDLTAHNQHADTIYKEKLVSRKLTLMLQQRDRQWEREEIADEANGHRINVFASAMLRKLNTRLFQIQTRQKNATSLEQRNIKKHFRNMFKHWQYRATERRTSQYSGQQLAPSQQQTPLLSGGMYNRWQPNRPGYTDQSSLSPGMTSVGQVDNDFLLPSTTNGTVHSIPGHFNAAPRDNSFLFNADLTRRAEEWTELDVATVGNDSGRSWIHAGLTDSSTSPKASPRKLPAYLTTPSKRAARARTLKVSATPQSLLRAPQSTTPPGRPRLALNQERSYQGKGTQQLEADVTAMSVVPEGSQEDEDSVE